MQREKDADFFLGGQLASQTQNWPYPPVSPRQRQCTSAHAPPLIAALFLACVLGVDAVTGQSLGQFSAAIAADAMTTSMRHAWSRALVS